MDIVSVENVCSAGEYCRLCAAESKNGITIYSPEGYKQCLEEKINNCLKISVSEHDLLPKHVCNSCRSRLDEYHKFTEEVNRVQHTLEILIQMSNFANTTTPTPEILPDQLETKPITEKDNNDSKPPDNLLFDRLVQISSEDKIDTIEIGNLLGNNEDQSNNENKLNDNLLNNDSLSSSLSKTCLNKLRKTNLETKKANKSCETLDSEVSNGIDSDSNNESKEEVCNQLQDEEVKGEIQNNLGIKCNRCNILFALKSQFDSHYRNSYEEKPLYTCSLCNKMIEKYSTFRSHCYRHLTEGRYRCKFCEKGFNVRNLLDLHIAAKHTEVKPFICDSCGKGFVTNSALTAHIKSHERLDKEEFPCKECGKILFTRGGFTSHINAHKLGRRFMCDLCGKTFTQKVNMQHHVKCHYGERPYTCEKCGKCFAEKSHLNRHYSFHSEKRPFKCSVCSKMYKTKRCLKVHNLVHADARPYVCSYCSKGFLSITKLKQHSIIHTGDRPYKCNYCERTFTNLPNWLKHTRRRHKVDHRTGVQCEELIDIGKAIATSKNFTSSENKISVNSNVNLEKRQNVESSSLACLTTQTFSYSSYLNPIPSTTISQVFTDHNFITHMLLPSQQILPL